LDSESIQILSFRDVGGGALEGPPEPHHVFLANALEKVLWSLHHFDLSQVDGVLVDDSGLCIPAFDYAPGVHSATFGGEPRSDGKNNEKLVNMIRKFHSSAQKGGGDEPQEFNGASLGIFLTFSKFLYVEN